MSFLLRKYHHFIRQVHIFCKYCSRKCTDRHHLLKIMIKQGHAWDLHMMTLQCVISLDLLQYIKELLRILALDQFSVNLMSIALWHHLHITVMTQYNALKSFMHRSVSTVSLHLSWVWIIDLKIKMIACAYFVFLFAQKHLYLTLCVINDIL